MKATLLTVEIWNVSGLIYLAHVFYFLLKPNALGLMQLIKK